jgi:hypothetical protein
VISTIETLNTQLLSLLIESTITKSLLAATKKWSHPPLLAQAQNVFKCMLTSRNVHVVSSVFQLLIQDSRALLQLLLPSHSPNKRHADAFKFNMAVVAVVADTACLDPSLSPCLFEVGDIGVPLCSFLEEISPDAPFATSLRVSVLTALSLWLHNHPSMVSSSTLLFMDVRKILSAFQQTLREYLKPVTAIDPIVALIPKPSGEVSVVLQSIKTLALTDRARPQLGLLPRLRHLSQFHEILDCIVDLLRAENDLVRLMAFDSVSAVLATSVIGDDQTDK